MSSAAANRSAPLLPRKSSLLGTPISRAAPPARRPARSRWQPKCEQDGADLEIGSARQGIGPQSLAAEV